MNFFGNNCGCGGCGDNERYNNCNCGGGFDFGGCNPCLLILILMLSGNKGGCGCGIDPCSIVWLLLISNCLCGGNHCGDC